MTVYNRATKVVPDNEKLSVYEIYIARVAVTFGAAGRREILRSSDRIWSC